MAVNSEYTFERVVYELQQHNNIGFIKWCLKHPRHLHEIFRRGNTYVLADDVTQTPIDAETEIFLSSS